MHKTAYWTVIEGRLADWITKALRRKPSGEQRVAGLLRAAGCHSAAVRRGLAEAAEVLVEREAFSRALYGAAIRSLSEQEQETAAPLLAEAMQRKHGGGLHTMAAAMSCTTAKLAEPLARVAASPKPHMAFAAALVMRARDQGHPGQLLSTVARIKESARIELCTELLAPMMLLNHHLPSLPASAGPPMRVMRDAERHLGRWLVFARAALAAGDRTSVEEAQLRSSEGSTSSRTAWSLLAWAIACEGTPPCVRPSAEILARLSDRPTSEKDMSFLFRLASVRSDGARAMLESLCKGSLRNAVTVRGASTLAGLYGDRRGLDRLREIADGARSRDLQGLSIAALFDAGEKEEALERAAELCESRSLPNAVWGGLVLGADGPVLDEMSFRRLELAMVQ